jgi:hypothetical protein
MTTIDRDDKVTSLTSSLIEEKSDALGYSFHAVLLCCRAVRTHYTCTRCATRSLRACILSRHTLPPTKENIRKRKVIGKRAARSISRCRVQNCSCNVQCCATRRLRNGVCTFVELILRSEIVAAQSWPSQLECVYLCMELVCVYALA